MFYRRFRHECACLSAERTKGLEGWEEQYLDYRARVTKRPGADEEALGDNDEESDEDEGRDLLEK
jgi:hypothetical protein